MLCVVGTGLLLGVSAPLLRLGGPARVASTTVLAWIGLPLRLLIGRVWLRIGLLMGRTRPPLRLLVRRIRLPLGLLIGRTRLALGPLVGRCKISSVGVPAAIALAHWSTLIGSYIGSHVWPIRCAIIVLAVRTVVGIAIKMAVGVTCHDVFKIVDNDDPEHDPGNRRCDYDDRCGHEIVAGVRPVLRPVVNAVVFAVIGIPVVAPVRAVHDQIEEPGDDNRPQNNPPDGDRRDLQGLSLGLADSGEPQGWDQNAGKDEDHGYSHVYTSSHLQSYPQLTIGHLCLSAHIVQFSD